MTKDRARGALLGLAVGDALGTTYEFDRLEQPAYPILATRPATDVVGGGPFDLAAGQVTDDTHMAICLARSLAAQRGLDVDDVAARYVAWSQHAFDIGNQTGSALRRVEAGTSGRLAGFETWRASERRAAGNGSLMRTAPIGVALRGDALIDGAIADALITHADPRCALACAVYDAAIAAAIDGTADPVTAARGALGVAEECLRATWAQTIVVTPDGRETPLAVAADLDCIARAVGELERDLAAAHADAPGVYGLELHLDRTAGFVRVAFRLAFWHAVHTASWRDALVDVASRGGDSDTNAAIVGALLGARDGAMAIPAAWIERVLGATQPGPAAWADDHHPRHLLALV